MNRLILWLGGLLLGAAVLDSLGDGEDHTPKMQAWIKAHRKDMRVLRWLRDNPPPAEWKGTAMEYAFSEMPDPGDPPPPKVAPPAAAAAPAEPKA